MSQYCDRKVLPRIYLNPRSVHAFFNIFNANLNQLIKKLTFRFFLIMQNKLRVRSAARLARLSILI